MIILYMINVIKKKTLNYVHNRLELNHILDFQNVKILHIENHYLTKKIIY